MLEQMCRTCLATSGELVSIFSNDYYVHNLPDKLLHTTRIEVAQDDDLPKMMCKKCIFLVDSLYCFKDQCEMAEIKLKKTLKKTCTNNVNIHLSPVKKGPGYHDDDYERIIGKAVDISDAVSSSEEDYQIEYASEEARLEVENARRRNKDKKKCYKSSEVKFKSIEAVPDEMCGKVAPVSTNKISEIDEDFLIFDSDDRSSFHVSDVSKVAANKPYKKKNYQSYTITEKIEFLKKQRNEKIKDKVSSPTNNKRKMEFENSYSSLNKVPKKVLFQDNDFNDEDMQFIEMNENKNNKIKNNDKTNVKESLKDDKMKVTSNNSETTQRYARRENNSLESQNFNKEIKHILDIRMESLIEEIVLSLPEICTICSKYFASHTDVLRHKIEYHLDSDQETFFCPICEQFFSKEDVANHLKEHKDIESYICIICSGNYYTKATLRTHLDTHVNLQDIQCKFCLKKLGRISTLAKHLDKHLSSSEMICIFCSKSFNSKDALQVHINSHHKKIKLDKNLPTENIEKYPCPYCESIFHTKTVLRDHVLIHLSKQQYSCLVCEKTFSSQEERTQHMQEHMKPQQKSDQKKFRCRVCHDILVSRLAYGQHLKEKHWMSKQTSEILKELSESGVNEKLNESPSKSCTSALSSDHLSL